MELAAKAVERHAATARQLEEPQHGALAIGRGRRGLHRTGEERAVELSVGVTEYVAAR
jgi:hypothetical protein